MYDLWMMGYLARLGCADMLLLPRSELFANVFGRKQLANHSDPGLWWDTFETKLR